MNKIIELEETASKQAIPMSFENFFNLEEVQNNLENQKQIFENKIQQIEQACAANATIMENLKSFEHNFEKQQSILTIHQPLIACEFNLAIEFEINYEKGNIIVVGRLCQKFGTPYLVIQKNLRIQFCRFFLRLNAVQKFGSFYISPTQGDICFKIYQQLNMAKPDWIKQELVKNIETAFQVIDHRFKGQMYRFLITLNKTDIYHYQKLEKYAEDHSINTNLKQFMVGALELLTAIKDIAEKDCTEGFSKKQYEEHQAIFNIQKSPNQIKLYNSIVFQDIGKAKQLNDGISGGFATVSKAEICFKDAESQINNYMKRTVAMKQAKDEKNSTKIEHEINIMKELNKWGSSPFIAQCYHYKQDNSKFYMEYYQHSSLDIFRQKFEQIMSLNTKLFILYNIGMGIKFLHDSRVIHMDLKPQNIFISKSYIAKLGDFGEAISFNVQDQCSPGKTYPYCAPEGTDSATINYDIFSFGLIIIELIFERIPIDFQMKNLENLIKNYENKTYKIQYNAHYIKKFPQKLFQYLYLIAFKCLNPIPENRPKIEWIIIAIRKAIQYIDKVY